MKPLSRDVSIMLLTSLSVVMVATRFHHLGSLIHLPDASMAVFFLGGLYLRRHRLFVLMLALAVGVDWASVGYAGNSDFCITAAYAFLPLSYAALWYGGRLYARHLEATAGSFALAFGVALISATVAFGISNGSFYWLGGRYPEPNVSQYVARLWQWGPLFVRTTMAYIAVALALHAVLARVIHRRVATVSPNHL
ncbi:MAG: hypothetical protein ABI767_02760 [Rhodanobacter sp.]